MSSKKGKLRIVGGKWRSRVITFPDKPDLRPTPDRIRETLFNWLAPYIEGAVCLDFFAGSGALGFEALSRGARKVVFVDHSKEVSSSLKENMKLLGESDCEIVLGEVPHHIPPLGITNFDIVFLDPPFKQGLIKASIDWLYAGGYLKPNALIYIESEQELVQLPIPEHWQIIQDQQTKRMRYCLVKSP